MTEQKTLKHHIWCNNQNVHFRGDQTESAKTCWMCANLKANYPEGNLTDEELMAKHFPNNKKVDIDG